MVYLKDMKRTSLKRTSYKRHSKGQLKRHSKGHKRTPRKKVANKGYKPPAWFNKIPYGSHGSTPAQKRYWYIISQTYRKADWEKYHGRCVSCATILADWREGDLAHFKRYSVCNSWFKFQRENLALSCKNCNRNDDGVVGYRFGEELKRRYHEHIIDWIEKTNESFRGQKMEVWELVDRVAQLRPDLVE